jgi:hypothetical protein
MDLHVQTLTASALAALGDYHMKERASSNARPDTEVWRLEAQLMDNDRSPFLRNAKRAVQHRPELHLVKGSQARKVPTLQKACYHVQEG